MSRGYGCSTVMAERGESSDEEPTIAEDVVVTKYKMAGDMANSKKIRPQSLKW